MLRQTIANNIAFYRNLSDMTQLQLAEAINYSDKSVSKWERGEGLPDIFVLHQIAELFHITVNDLLNPSKKKRMPFEKRSKLLVSLISVGLVWLVAVIVYVALMLFTETTMAWLAYIYAIPVSAIVMLVFSCIWAKRVWQGLATSTLIWGLAGSVYLTFSIATNRIWLIFLIAIPLQILAILWFFLRQILQKMHLVKPVETQLADTVEKE